jgi:hypothetical protein
LPDNDNNIGNGGCGIGGRPGGEGCGPILNNDKRYPKAKLLKSGDYFLIYSLGIQIYKSDFSFKENIYDFKEREKINNDHDYRNTKISDYIDDKNYYILTIIKGELIFIYDYYNNISYIDGNLKIEKGQNYDLIYYKFENNILYYVITVLNPSKINFYLYKMNFTSLDNENVIEAQNNYSNDKIKGEFFSCNQISLEKEQLVCFILLEFNAHKDKVYAYIFNLNNNFEYIDNTEYNTNMKIKQIQSIYLDGKKSFICFLGDSDKFYFLSYNIEKNEFKDIITINNEESKLFEIFSFHETNQYIFIYYNNSKQFKIKLFNENFTNVVIDSNIETIDNLGCDEITGFSIVYSITNQKYGLINDCKNRSQNNWEIINISTSIEAYYINYSDFNYVKSSLDSSISSINITDLISDSSISSIFIPNSVSTNLLSSFPLSSTIISNSVSTYLSYLSSNFSLSSTIISNSVSTYLSSNFSLSSTIVSNSMSTYLSSSNLLTSSNIYLYSDISNSSLITETTNINKNKEIIKITEKKKKKLLKICKK